MRQNIGIGGTTVIEENVRIDMFVVLAAHKGAAPILRKGSTIGSGAVVLGGVTVGSGATVGANSVVVTDVPNLNTVLGSPARTVSVGR